MCDLGEEAEELFETNWDLEVDNFDDMGLKEEVLRGIYAFGFKEPSPIQQKGILPIIQSKDTIAQVIINFHRRRGGKLLPIVVIDSHLSR